MEINRVSALAHRENFLIKRNSLFYRAMHTHMHAHTNTHTESRIRIKTKMPYAKWGGFFGSLLPPIKASISWYKINCTSGWFSKTYKTETLRKKSSRSSKQRVQWDSEWFPWELANEHLPSLTPQAQRLENTVIIDLSEGGTAQPINESPRILE